MAKALIIADFYEGMLRKATRHTISAARAVLDAAGGGTFDIAILGAGAQGAAAELTGFGAGTVYAVEGESIAHYTAESWAPAVADLARKSGAGFVLMAASTQGKDLMPRVAGILGAGMAADILSAHGDGGAVRYKRPMWAGNIIATVAVDTPIHVITARPTEFPEAAPTGDASPVEAVAWAGEAGGTTFEGFAASGGARPDLGDATVVVAGGRGLKDKDGFWAITTPLADALGAAIGATRAAVDSGFAPNDLQIGQTGRVVAPNLYFAIAISGAIQHLAGMKASKCIVAINKDPDAPIFQVADYGLVADAFKAVPELVEKLR